MSRRVLHCMLLVALNELTFYVSGQNWLLDQLLPSGYNKTEVPFKQTGSNATFPLNVTINIATFTVSEKDNSVDTSLTLCLKWRDYRFTNLTSVTYPGDSTPDNTLHFTTVQITEIDRLWLPIVHFRNALSTSVVNALADVQYATVYPDIKQVNFCTKMKVTFSCKIGFHNFPFDENHCTIELEDFEQSVQHLRLHVENFKTPEGSSKLRIRKSYVETCQPFYLNSFYQISSDSYAMFSNQSCAAITVKLVRRVGYYVIRYYAPSFLLVVMTFTSLWMPTNAWPGRITITAVVLLTVITASTTAYNEIPARDVVSLYWWYWGCQMFVYLTLIEYGLALSWVQFVNDKKKARAENKESPDGIYFGKNGCYAACGRGIEKCLHAIYGPIDFFASPENRNKVDYVGRILFVFFWLVFVMAYLLATVPAWSERYRY